MLNSISFPEIKSFKGNNETKLRQGEIILNFWYNLDFYPTGEVKLVSKHRNYSYERDIPEESYYEKYFTGNYEIVSENSDKIISQINLNYVEEISENKKLCSTCDIILLFFEDKLQNLNLFSPQDFISPEIIEEFCKKERENIDCLILTGERSLLNIIEIIKENGNDLISYYIRTYPNYNLEQNYKFLIENLRLTEKYPDGNVYVSDKKGYEKEIRKIAYSHLVAAKGDPFSVFFLLRPTLTFTKFNEYLFMRGEKNCQKNLEYFRMNTENHLLSSCIIDFEKKIIYKKLYEEYLKNFPQENDENKIYKELKNKNSFKEVIKDNPEARKIIFQRELKFLNEYGYLDEEKNLRIFNIEESPDWKSFNDRCHLVSACESYLSHAIYTEAIETKVFLRKNFYNDIQNFGMDFDNYVRFEIKTIHSKNLEFIENLGFKDEQQNYSFFKKYIYPNAYISEEELVDELIKIYFTEDTIKNLGFEKNYEFIRKVINNEINLESFYLDHLRKKYENVLILLKEHQFNNDEKNMIFLKENESPLITNFDDYEWLAEKLYEKYFEREEFSDIRKINKNRDIKFLMELNKSHLSVHDYAKKFIFEKRKIYIDEIKKIGFNDDEKNFQILTKNGLFFLDQEIDIQFLFGVCFADYFVNSDYYKINESSMKLDGFMKLYEKNKRDYELTYVEFIRETFSDKLAVLNIHGYCNEQINIDLIKKIDYYEYTFEERLLKDINFAYFPSKLEEKLLYLYPEINDINLKKLASDYKDDIALFIMNSLYPGFLPLLDVFSPNTLALILNRSRNKVNNIDEFNKFVGELLVYFKTKGIEISNEDIVTFFMHITVEENTLDDLFNSFLNICMDILTRKHINPSFYDWLYDHEKLNEYCIENQETLSKMIIKQNYPIYLPLTEKFLAVDILNFSYKTGYNFNDLDAFYDYMEKAKQALIEKNLEFNETIFIRMEACIDIYQSISRLLDNYKHFNNLCKKLEEKRAQFPQATDIIILKHFDRYTE